MLTLASATRHQSGIIAKIVHFCRRRQRVTAGVNLRKALPRVSTPKVQPALTWLLGVRRDVAPHTRRLAGCFANLRHKCTYARSFRHASIQLQKHQSCAILAA